MSKLVFQEKVNKVICDKLASISFKQFLTFYTKEELDENGNLIDIRIQYNN